MLKNKWKILNFKPIFLVTFNRKRWVDLLCSFLNSFSCNSSCWEWTCL